jgi:hypothetical protein
MNLLLSYGTMHDSPRDDQKLAFLQPKLPFGKIHSKPPLNHQKKFVLVVVFVPDEFPLELDEFYVLAIEFADNSRMPVVTEKSEFFL